MAGGYQYCSSCKRIEKNMTIYICPKCNNPYRTVSDNMEDKNGNEKWYVKCGSCEKWISFDNKDDIPKICPKCNDTEIRNAGEDSILSEEEYLLEIGEMQPQNELVENDSVQEDTEKKASPEEEENLENEQKDQSDTPDLGNTSKDDETENVEGQVKDDQYEQSDETENDGIIEKSYGQEIKSEEQRSGLKKIGYIEFINNNDGKVIRMGRGKHILGKLGDVESDYFSEKRYIGRQHAMVGVSETDVFIEDWNSTNGTRINGEMIYKRQGKMRIVNGDIVTMADQNFEVRICR